MARPHTLQRIWRESQTLSIGEGGTFRARVIADFGRTVDGDSVLRVERTITHFTVGFEFCEGCPACSGLMLSEIAVDSAERTREAAYRLAIRHADEVFEQLAVAVQRATTPVDAVQEAQPCAEP